MLGRVTCESQAVVSNVEIGKISCLCIAKSGEYVKLKHLMYVSARTNECSQSIFEAHT